MFGLSFGEIIILLVVGIVVVGPKNLPGLMRTAGKWIAKARRMSVDLRSQSGIDDLIRKEGLEREIQELRSLARMNVVGSLINSATSPSPDAMFGPGSLAPLKAKPDALPPDFTKREPPRAREFPPIGCDAYDALADDAVIYPPPPPAEAPKAEEAAPSDAKADDAPASPPKPAGLVIAPAAGTVAWSPTPLIAADDAPVTDERG